MDAPDARPDISPRTFLQLTSALILTPGVPQHTRLGDRTVVSEEFRWVEIAKNMRSSGDYFNPSINGRIYFDKPVGSYWLIVAASQFVGGVDVVAARLPPAIAALLAIILLIDLTRRLYDRRTAILAGAILAGGFDFVKYGRHASADMETLTGVLLAVRLFALIPGQIAPWRIVALWVLMAAVSQTKGLLGFVLPIAVLGVFGTRHGLSKSPDYSPKSLLMAFVRGNRWFFSWWTVLAMPLGIALFFTPYAIAGMQSDSQAGLELLYRENIKRFIAPHNHTGPIWLYMPEIFVLAAPWSLFLPAAIVLTYFRRGPSDRFTTSYFWAIFVFFTLSASRRNYYLLPILPAASILLAQVWTFEPLPAIVRRLRGGGVVLFLPLTIVAGLALVPTSILPAPYNQLPTLPNALGYAAGWVVSLGALAFVCLCRPRLLPVSIACVSIVAMAYVHLTLMPEMEKYRTRPAFAAEVMAKIEADSNELALFHARDVLYDLGLDSVPDYTDMEQLRVDVRERRVRWVIARKKYLNNDFPSATIVLEERSNPWEGENQLAEKMVLFEMRATK